MHLILRVQICYIYLCVYPCIRTAYHFPRQSKIRLSRGARDVATKFRNLRIFHFAQKLEGQNTWSTGISREVEVNTEIEGPGVEEETNL